MDTLWSCVIAIVILYFIGVLVWLLLRKHTTSSKKLKGGGIKMKGGDLPTPLEFMLGLFSIVTSNNTLWMNKAVNILTLIEYGNAGDPIPYIQAAEVAASAMSNAMGMFQGDIREKLIALMQGVIKTPIDSVQLIVEALKSLNDGLIRNNISAQQLAALIMIAGNNSNAITFMTSAESAITFMTSAAAAAGNEIIHLALNAIMKSPYMPRFVAAVQGGPFLAYISTTWEISYLSRAFMILRSWNPSEPAQNPAMQYIIIDIVSGWGALALVISYIRMTKDESLLPVIATAAQIAAQNPIQNDAQTILNRSILLLHIGVSIPGAGVDAVKKGFEIAKLLMTVDDLYYIWYFIDVSCHYRNTLPPVFYLELYNEWIKPLIKAATVRNVELSHPGEIDFDTIVHTIIMPISDADSNTCIMSILQQQIAAQNTVASESAKAAAQIAHNLVSID